MIKGLIKKSFSSKILLFGEYSILLNSQALAVPYSLFEGELVFPSGDANVPTDSFYIGRQELASLGEFIRELSLKREDNFEFDYTSFSFDMEQGLYFKSTIPQGYGLGSSGAITAAIFSAYGKLKIENHKDIYKLKDIFSKIESYFHGKSSGLDPLVSYFNNPILVKSKNNLGTVQIPFLNKNKKGAIFLLNTRTPRKTSPLMNLFLEKIKNKFFFDECQNKLIPLTNLCINHFLDGKRDELFQIYKKLSDFQYQYLTSMIPNHFRSIWNEGLKTGDYYLKLCGAGGGGFLLGMTLDFQKTSHNLQKKNIRPLYMI